MSGVTRRGLLQTAAVGAVAAGVGVGAPAIAGGPTAGTTRSPRRDVDVVVVGAGLAGLSAARELTRAGRSVLVLEARDRVGGRTLNHHLGNGYHGDMGGTWIGPTQDRIAAMAKAYGVHAFDQPDAGDQVYYANGIRRTYSDSSPLGVVPPDPTIDGDVVLLVEQLDQMATEIPIGRPWEAPHAADWDRQTLESFIRSTTANPETWRVASAAFEALVGAEPRDVSLLYAVDYIATATDGSTYGTFERLIGTRGGAQAQRFVEGAQEISIRMARGLGKGRVQLSAPVRRITQERTGVMVVSDAGTYRARHVVVAIPPHLASRIDYDPLLPSRRDQLTQALRMGSLIKVEAFYDKPWWRDLGLSGATVSDVGPAKTTFDVSPKDGKIGGLLGFVGGDEAHQWTGNPEGLKRAVLENFRTFFNSDKALHPTSIEVQDWTTERWTRGCPVALAGPGVITEFGESLVAPVGRIHWAGTETATYWHGYMDGAVRSGERAAADILGEL